MFEKNSKKSHDSDGMLWAIFIIMVTAVTFFTVMEISKEKADVFSVDSYDATASVKNITVEDVKATEDVSVMIVPVN